MENEQRRIACPYWSRVVEKPGYIMALCSLEDLEAQRRKGLDLEEWQRMEICPLPFGFNRYKALNSPTIFLFRNGDEGLYLIYDLKEFSFLLQGKNFDEAWELATEWFRSFKEENDNLPLNL